MKVNIMSESLKEEKKRKLKLPLILKKIFEISSKFDIGVKENFNNLKKMDFGYSRIAISSLSKNDNVYNVSFLTNPKAESIGILTFTKNTEYDNFKLQHYHIQDNKLLEESLRKFFQIVENTIFIDGN